MTKFTDPMYLKIYNMSDALTYYVPEEFYVSNIIDKIPHYATYLELFFSQK